MTLGDSTRKPDTSHSTAGVSGNIMADASSASAAAMLRTKSNTRARLIRLKDPPSRERVSAAIAMVRSRQASTTSGKDQDHLNERSVVATPTLESLRNQTTTPTRAPLTPKEASFQQSPTSSRQSRMRSPSSSQAQTATKERHSPPVAFFLNVFGRRTPAASTSRTSSVVTDQENESTASRIPPPPPQTPPPPFAIPPPPPLPDIRNSATATPTASVHSLASSDASARARRLANIRARVLAKREERSASSSGTGMPTSPEASTLAALLSPRAGEGMKKYIQHWSDNQDPKDVSPTKYPVLMDSEISKDDDDIEKMSDTSSVASYSSSEEVPNVDPDTLANVTRFIDALNQQRQQQQQQPKQDVDATPNIPMFATMSSESGSSLPESSLFDPDVLQGLGNLIDKLQHQQNSTTESPVVEESVPVESQSEDDDNIEPELAELSDQHVYTDYSATFTESTLGEVQPETLAHIVAYIDSLANVSAAGNNTSYHDAAEMEEDRVDPPTVHERDYVPDVLSALKPLSTSTPASSAHLLDDENEENEQRGNFDLKVLSTESKTTSFFESKFEDLSPSTSSIDEKPQEATILLESESKIDDLSEQPSTGTGSDTPQEAATKVEPVSETASFSIDVEATVNAMGNVVVTKDMDISKPSNMFDSAAAVKSIDIQDGILRKSDVPQTQPVLMLDSEDEISTSSSEQQQERALSPFAETQEHVIGSFIDTLNKVVTEASPQRLRETTVPGLRKNDVYGINDQSFICPSTNDCAGQITHSISTTSLHLFEQDVNDELAVLDQPTELELVSSAARDTGATNQPAPSSAEVIVSSFMSSAVSGNQERIIGAFIDSLTGSTASLLTMTAKDPTAFFAQAGAESKHTMTIRDPTAFLVHTDRSGDSSCDKSGQDLKDFAAANMILRAVSSDEDSLYVKQNFDPVTLEREAFERALMRIDSSAEGTSFQDVVSTGSYDPIAEARSESIRLDESFAQPHVDESFAQPHVDESFAQVDDERTSSSCAIDNRVDLSGIIYNDSFKLCLNSDESTVASDFATSDRVQETESDQRSEKGLEGEAGKSMPEPNTNECLISTAKVIITNDCVAFPPELETRVTFEGLAEQLVSFEREASFHETFETTASQAMISSDESEAIESSSSESESNLMYEAILEEEEVSAPIIAYVKMDSIDSEELPATRGFSNENFFRASTSSAVEDEKKDDSSPDDDEEEDDSIDSIKYVQVGSFDQFLDPSLGMFGFSADFEIKHGLIVPLSEQSSVEEKPCWNEPLYHDQLSEPPPELEFSEARHSEPTDVPVVESHISKSSEPSKEPEIPTDVPEVQSLISKSSELLKEPEIIEARGSDHTGVPEVESHISQLSTPSKESEVPTDVPEVQSLISQSSKLFKEPEIIEARGSDHTGVPEAVSHISQSSTPSFIDARSSDHTYFPEVESHIKSSESSKEPEISEAALSEPIEVPKVALEELGSYIAQSSEPSKELEIFEARRSVPKFAHKELVSYTAQSSEPLKELGISEARRSEVSNAEVALEELERYTAQSSESLKELEISEGRFPDATLVPEDVESYLTQSSETSKELETSEAESPQAEYVPEVALDEIESYIAKLSEPLKELEIGEARLTDATHVSEEFDSYLSQSSETSKEPEISEARSSQALDVPEDAKDEFESHLAQLSEPLKEFGTIDAEGSEALDVPEVSLEEFESHLAQSSEPLKELGTVEAKGSEALDVPEVSLEFESHLAQSSTPLKELGTVEAKGSEALDVPEVSLEEFESHLAQSSAPLKELGTLEAKGPDALDVPEVSPEEFESSDTLSVPEVELDELEGMSSGERFSPELHSSDTRLGSNYSLSPSHLLGEDIFKSSASLDQQDHSVVDENVSKSEVLFEPTSTQPDWERNENEVEVESTSAPLMSNGEELSCSEYRSPNERKKDPENTNVREEGDYDFVDGKIILHYTGGEVFESHDNMQSSDNSKVPISKQRSSVAEHTHNLRLVGTFVINPSPTSNSEHHEGKGDVTANDLFNIARESERLDLLVQSLLQVSGSDDSSKLFPDSISKFSSDELLEHFQLSCDSSSDQMQVCKNDVAVLKTHPNDDETAYSAVGNEKDLHYVAGLLSDSVAANLTGTGMNAVEEIVEVSPTSETDEIEMHSQVFEAANVVVESMKLADQLLSEVVRTEVPQDQSWPSSSDENVNREIDGDLNMCLQSNTESSKVSHVSVDDLLQDVLASQTEVRRNGNLKGQHVIEHDESSNHAGSITKLLDKLSTPHGASDEEIEQLNEFVNVASPILHGSQPTVIEEAQIRQASQRAGLPSYLVDQVLDLALERNQEIQEVASSSTVGIGTPKHMKKMFDEILDVDENDNILAFFRRFAALNAGGHYPDANMEALGSFGRVSSDGDEVEVDVVRGYVRKELGQSEVDSMEIMPAKASNREYHYGAKGEMRESEGKGSVVMESDSVAVGCELDQFRVVELLLKGTDEVQLQSEPSQLVELLAPGHLPKQSSSSCVEFDFNTIKGTTTFDDIKDIGQTENVLSDVTAAAGGHFPYSDIGTLGFFGKSARDGDGFEAGAIEGFLQTEFGHSESQGASVKQDEGVGHHFNLRDGVFENETSTCDNSETEQERPAVRAESAISALLDRLSSPEGASEEEIELLNEFVKVAAPIFQGLQPTVVEEALIRQASQRAGLPAHFVDQVLDLAAQRNQDLYQLASSSTDGVGTPKHMKKVFDDISDVDENENISAFFRRFAALEAGGHYPGANMEALGSFGKVSSDGDEVEVDVDRGYVRKEFEQSQVFSNSEKEKVARDCDFRTERDGLAEPSTFTEPFEQVDGLMCALLQPGPTEKTISALLDRLSTPEGASDEEIEQLNEFIKIAAPILQGTQPTVVEEALIRKASQLAGLPDYFVDQVLDLASDRNHNLGPAASSSSLCGSTPKHMKNAFDDISEVDENENISAFFRRFAALKAGGHYPDANIDALGSFGMVSNDGDEVEVDVDRGFVRKEFDQLQLGSAEAPDWVDQKVAEISLQNSGASEASVTYPNPVVNGDTGISEHSPENIPSFRSNELPTQVVDKLTDHALHRSSTVTSNSGESSTPIHQKQVFDEISDVDENENISAFFNRLSALKAGGHFPDLTLDNLGSLVTMSSDGDAVEIDLKCGFVKKHLAESARETPVRMDTLSPLSNEQFSHGDAASLDSVEQLNTFMQAAAPYLKESNPTAIEEARIRQAATKAGVSLDVIDRLIEPLIEPIEDASVDHDDGRNQYDVIEDVDENEAIDAFLHRFTALKQGGHFPDANLDALGPLGRFSPENEEAVEIDVAHGFVRKELAPCLSDEAPWWEDASARAESVQESIELTGVKRYESFNSIGCPSIRGNDAQLEKASTPKGGRYDSSEDWDAGGMKVKAEWPSQCAIKQFPPKESFDAVEMTKDNFAFFRELDLRQSNANEWIMKDSMANWGNPFKQKSWLIRSVRLGRPKPINGVAAAVALSKRNIGTSKRKSSGGPQHWKRSYKQRTRNHPGYFNVDVYSLYETSLVAGPSHPLDYIPWENREVRQRFLHEQSISFSRNWFGKLLRVRGNDRNREPVCHPKSMEMPHENYPHPGEWTEEWYTPWKRPRDQDEASSEASSYSSDSEFDESDSSTVEGDDDSTQHSGKKSEGSQDKYTKCSFSNDGSDDDSSWEDIPECGNLKTVKLRIGEHISRVHPNYTSSLRRSRWRLKYFPRGTFPY